MKRIIKEQVKGQVKEQVSQILQRIEQSVNAQLEAEVLIRSSHSSRTSYAVATDLSEIELKKNLIEKMEGNKSDEGPSTGSNRGSKRQREGKEPESASTPLETITRSTGANDQPIVQSSQHPEWFSKPQKPPTLDRDWNKTLSAIQRSTQTWISELAKQADSRSCFNELLDTPLDFSNFIMNWLRVDTLTPELLARPTFELMKGSCTSLIELEYHLEEVYKATTDQLDRSTLKFYGFAVNRESALDVYSKRRMITVADLKIVDWHSYKHLDWITDKKNRLMQIDELHKFSDGTLNDVRNALDDRLKGIRMQYLPQTIWRKGDKDRAAAMIQAIDKMLKTRRIMRSLEKFIGGSETVTHRFTLIVLSALRRSYNENMLSLINLILRKWKYLIPADSQIHNHMLIPNNQDIIFQDFHYFDEFECYQVIKIERYEHETLKRKWKYLILADSQIHNHMLIPNYQDIIFQDFHYFYEFECYQVIKIERKSSTTDVETSINEEVFHETAFLNEILKEEVYVDQPSGFVSKQYPHHMYTLDKALYGLKQAPRAWYYVFSQFLIDCGFQKVPTPMVEQAKLKLDLVGKLADHTDYRSMIGSLMYVTSSRPDIMFATYIHSKGFILAYVDGLTRCDLVTLRILLWSSRNRIDLPWSLPSHLGKLGLGDGV
nr:reverse transcriptase [Tanacetum cinerariifolium]